jgi:hypothetical protein
MDSCHSVTLFSYPRISYHYFIRTLFDDIIWDSTIVPNDSLSTVRFDFQSLWCLFEGSCFKLLLSSNGNTFNYDLSWSDRGSNVSRKFCGPHTGRMRLVDVIPFAICMRLIVGLVISIFTYCNSLRNLRVVIIACVRKLFDRISDVLT